MTDTIYWSVVGDPELWIIGSYSVEEFVGYLRPKAPSKSAGRVGTRRAWKRAHPPGPYILVRDVRPNGETVSLIQC